MPKLHCYTGSKQWNSLFTVCLPWCLKTVSEALCFTCLPWGIHPPPSALYHVYSSNFQIQLIGCYLFPPFWLDKQAGEVSVSHLYMFLILNISNFQAPWFFLFTLYVCFQTFPCTASFVLVLVLVLVSLSILETVPIFCNILVGLETSLIIKSLLSNNNYSLVARWKEVQRAFFSSRPLLCFSPNLVLESG